MSTVELSDQSIGARPNTAIGSWRFLTIALGRRMPQYLGQSQHYRRAALREISSRRRVTR